MTAVNEVERSASVDRPADRRAPGPRTLPVALAGILAAAIALIGFGVGWLVFDDGDTTSTGSSEMPTVVERWADAWVDRDADALAALYADDGLFDGIFAVGFEGRDNIRDSIDGYWTDTQVVELEPDYVFANEVGAVVIWNVVTSDEDGNTVSFQQVTDYEWDWDDPNLLRGTSMNW